MIKMLILPSRRLLITLVTLITISLFAASPAKATLENSKFQSGKAPFVLKVNAKTIPFNQYFQTVMPGESLTFSKTSASEAQGSLQLASADALIPWSKNTAKWQAPKTPGLYTITTTQANTGRQISLSVFVLRPLSETKNGKLNGYNIGYYPAPLKGLKSYAAPKGLIEVTKANQNTQITPHFTLQQFLCKQAGGYPKYVALRHNLLENLENLLGTVNAKGIRTDSFVIMSGYRTPAYNKAIGNVANSRHIYGGASDIYIDAKTNGVMDDLNGDGKINKKDASVLYNVANNHDIHDNRQDLLGGLGVYKANSAHGPFMHVDVRGSKARWGI